MMTATWAMVLQAVVAAPSAPPAIISTSPGRVPQVMMASHEPRQRYAVDFEIRSGKALLHAGTLNVATGTPSNFRREQNEPADERCGAERYGGPTVQQSLNLQLSLGRYTTADRLGVSLRWGRSADGACPLAQSARAVELNDSVVLTPGKPLTLTADGGLAITLTRR